MLNLNLEALVNFSYQEKLKRDRIGIIFEKAKKKAWDPQQLAYRRQSSTQTSASSQPADSKTNYRKLELEQDNIVYDSEGTPVELPKEPEGEQAKAPLDDYNDMFENVI